MRALNPGVEVVQIRGDFDSAWAVQGVVHGRTPEVLKKYLLGRPALSIVPLAPHSPNANFAENNVGRLYALAFACAFGGNLAMAVAWADMLRGAEYLFALQLVQGDRRVLGRAAQLQTRWAALLGTKFDVSRVPGPPGRLCWIIDENSPGKVLSGYPKALMAYIIAPDFVIGGLWVRLYGGAGKAMLVRGAYALDDRSARSVLLDGSSACTFRGSLSDPAPSVQHERLCALITDYAAVPTADMHMLVYTVDPRTGAPTKITRLIAALDGDGELTMIPADRPDVSPPLGADLPLSESFHVIPDASPRIRAWLQSLSPSTFVRVNPDPSRAIRCAAGAPNASDLRRLSYASATTIGALGPLSGQLAKDIWFDIARGRILVSAVPPSVHVVATLPATVVVQPEQTVAAFKYLESLEERHTPDKEDPIVDCAALLSEALTPLHAFAARVLRESLADESRSVCVG
jgi:hypothetical protein